MTRVFTFDDFSDTTGLVIQQDSLVVSDVLRVEPNDGASSIGSVWYSDAVRLEKEWEIGFVFNINNPVSGTDADGLGGDGMALLIQGLGNTATTGSGGAGLGYSGMNQSLAVEIDTLNNFTAPWNETDGNHIAIHSGGSGTNSSQSSERKATVFIPARFEDSGDHSLKVTYDLTTIEVFLDGSSVVSWNPPSNLGTYLGLSGGLGWVGFTAAIGTAKENLDVHSWYGNFFVEPHVSSMEAEFRAFR